LIARGAIVLVARGADNEAYADGIAAVVKRSPVHLSFDFDGWWKDVAEAVRAVIPGWSEGPDPESRDTQVRNRAP